MRFLVIVCVPFIVLGMIAPQASAATGHGCAPSTPPPVAGTLASPPATYHLLFINEVLPTPGSVWNCSELGTQPADTPTNAWVEIYNPQNQPFDLYAARASLDSGPGTNYFIFPFGAAIPAHGFLVVFPDVLLAFHSTATATLRLLIAGTVIDQVTLPPQVPSDTSYARVPDGGSAWQICEAPTIDATNTPPATPPPPTVKTGRISSGGWIDTGASGKKLVSGKQPLWSTLQLPASTPSSTVTSTPTAARISAPASTGGVMDVARKSLLTLLSAALALALLWCWRLFRTP